MENKRDHESFRSGESKLRLSDPGLRILAAHMYTWRCETKITVWENKSGVKLESFGNNVTGFGQIQTRINHTCPV
jgi:hypothetical protein